MSIELDGHSRRCSRRRPSSYAATYYRRYALTTQSGARGYWRGQPSVTSAANPTSPLADTGVSVERTYPVLRPRVHMIVSRARRGNFVKVWLRATQELGQGRETTEELGEIHGAQVRSWL